MRRFQILNISPSANPTAPSTFEIGLDVTQLFHGREWIDGSGARFPVYAYDNDPGTAAVPPPLGTGVLLATTFEVVENAVFNGRYTVFTKTTPSSLNSSELVGGNTIIRVNEAMPAASGADLTSGYITNISTYLLNITGEPSIVLLEQQNVISRPIELMGNRASGWGEVFSQNMLRLAQSFAGPSAPAAPFLGQLWYDTVNEQLKVNGMFGWGVTNVGLTGSSVRHIQSTASDSWVIQHELQLTSPGFSCSADFFIDVGAGVYKHIGPLDITYDNANQLTATFTDPQVGYAIIRS